MAIVPIFHAKVSDDGTRLEFDEDERHLRREYLTHLAGRQVDVVVKIHRNKHSDGQRKWHHGIAVPLFAEALGYDKHEQAEVHDLVHYWLVAQCFGTTWNPKVKLDIPNARSSQLTTVQYSELMEWEVRFGAMEYGIYVPLPGDAEVE